MDATTKPSHRKWDMIAGLALAGALLTIVIVDRVLGPTGAEIVFIVDQRPVMKSLRLAIRDRCLKTAKSLQDQGMHCRFAVIPFGGERSHLPMVELTSDLNVFRNQFEAAPGDAAPIDDTAVRAMERALKWTYREGEPVIFYLISATPCANADEVRDVANHLGQRGIVTFIQAGEEAQTACQPLLDIGGRFITFEGKVSKSTATSAKTRTRAASLVAKLSSQNEVPFPVDGLIYSARTSANRMEIVEKGGGTKESEKAVADGLDWLARHQADDGHWSDHGKCEKGNICPAGNFLRGATHAETGLAILAFQAGGYYDFNGKSNERPEAERYSQVVQRGLDWLVEHQGEDGRWFGPVATWYEHGMAMFAMTEACAVAYANRREPNPRYLYAAKKAIKFLEDHQYEQGGWQYAIDSRGTGDTSVSGWQALALKSALEAEIPVAPETMSRVKYFFEQSWNPNTGETQYMPKYGSATPLTTAVGLIVQHFIAKSPDSTIAVKSAEFLTPKAAAGIGRTGDFYTLYNCNLAMFLAGEDVWTNWNGAVRDEIIKRQITTGCARGSWINNYGRTLDTAWAILALEVYYRYSPGYVPKREFDLSQ